MRLPRMCQGAYFVWSLRLSDALRRTSVTNILRHWCSRQTAKEPRRRRLRCGSWDTWETPTSSHSRAQIKEFKYQTDPKCIHYLHRYILADADGCLSLDPYWTGDSCPVQAAVSTWVLTQVLLVVILGVVEKPAVGYFCCDGAETFLGQHLEEAATKTQCEDSQGRQLCPTNGSRGCRSTGRTDGQDTKKSAWWEIKLYSISTNVVNLKRCRVSTWAVPTFRILRVFLCTCLCACPTSCRRKEEMCSRQPAKKLKTDNAARTFIRGWHLLLLVIK